MCRQYLPPPERWEPLARLHSLATQKTIIFTAAETSGFIQGSDVLRLSVLVSLEDYSTKLSVSRMYSVE
jgi:hypothetical protein